MLLVEDNLDMEPTVIDTLRSRLPDGVLRRVRYPVCRLDFTNQNRRVYERGVWDHVLQNEDFRRKLGSRTLFGQAEHPTTTQSNLEKTSHVITKSEICEQNGSPWLIQEFDILDTPYGRIIETLLKAGCKVGVSTRGEGELEEKVEESGEKTFRVVPDSYNYYATDFTADPSTVGTIPETVQKGVTSEIEKGLTSETLDRKYAVSLLESMKCNEAKSLLESVKLEEDDLDVSSMGDDELVAKKEEVEQSTKDAEVSPSLIHQRLAQLKAEIKRRGLDIEPEEELDFSRFKPDEEVGMGEGVYKKEDGSELVLDKNMKGKIKAVSEGMATVQVGDDIIQVTDPAKLIVVSGATKVEIISSEDAVIDEPPVQSIEKPPAEEELVSGNASMEEPVIEPEEKEVPESKKKANEQREQPTGFDANGDAITKGSQVMYDGGSGRILAIWDDGTVDVSISGPGGEGSDTIDIKGQNVVKSDKNFDESKKKIKEGEGERGKCDGTGPYKDSAQRSISKKGKRKETGEECPFDEKEVEEKTVESRLREKVIHKKDGWYVESSEGKNLGGPFKTKDSAVKRLRQVEYFKNKKESKSVEERLENIKDLPFEEDVKKIIEMPQDQIASALGISFGVADLIQEALQMLDPSEIRNAEELAKEIDKEVEIPDVEERLVKEALKSPVKRVEGINKLLTTLKIKEASVRAERDLLEERVKRLQKGLSVAKGELLVWEKKSTKQAKSIKELTTKLDQTEMDLNNKIGEALASQKSELDKIHENRIGIIVKKYIDLVEKGTGLRISRSSRALLEMSSSIEELERGLEDIREEIRESALHPEKAVDSIKIVEELSKRSSNDALVEVARTAVKGMFRG